VFGIVFSFFATLFTFFAGFLAFFNSLRFLAIAASCPLQCAPCGFIGHFDLRRHRGSQSKKSFAWQGGERGRRLAMKLKLKMAAKR
jgi:hypothetical protein